MVDEELTMQSYGFSQRCVESQGPHYNIPISREQSLVVDRSLVRLKSSMMLFI